MRAGMFVSAAVALVCAAGTGALPGEPKAKAAIERLIGQLGDDDFTRREEATRELAALGKPALRALRQAAASSGDPEIRRRAERALARIYARLPDLMQAAREVRCINWLGVHVYSTSFAPDGRTFLAGGDGNTIRLFDVMTGDLVRELAGHQHWIGHALFTPDSKQVLSSSADHTLRLWDVGTGREVRKLAEVADGICSLDVRRDGKRALAGCGDGSVRLYELATGTEVGKLSGPRGSCLGCFTADGSQVLSACDRTLRLRDAGTGKELRTFVGHAAPLHGIHLLPGGKQALSYSEDQTARIWDLATGKEVRKLDVGPQLADIRGLALAPDGKRILVGGCYSNEVRLIEVASGKELHRFNLAAPPRGLSFSPDGRHAASGTWRGFVYLWKMPGPFDDE